MLPKIPFTENMQNASPEHVGVMQLSALMGELLLKNGGEIYRVQDTLHRVIDACGFPNHSVYVISNGLFIAINEGQPDACTSLRHIPAASVNLSMIAEINQISRDICSGTLDRDSAYQRLLECASPPRDKKWVMILACAFGSAGFSVLFGGSLLDGAAAWIVGFFLQIFLYLLQDHKVTRFPSNIIAAFFVTILSALFVATPVPLTFNLVVIGSIIPLVPGYSFNTSIREFFNGDYLSGLIHMIDAIMLAFCIAIGVGFGIRLIQLAGFGGLLL